MTGLSGSLRAFIVNAFLLLFLAASAQAQSVPLWGRWERSFTAAASDPTNIQFVVELTSPSGKVFNIDGFWDGGSTWRARFMPTESGTWRFKSYSLPSVQGLDSKTGSFTCERQAGNSRFRQHGAIRVAANGRYFEHADGRPFFWMGDTAWYGAILSSEEDWNTYLADRASKKFSVVHFNVVAPRNGVAADENGEVSFEGAERIEIPPSPFDRILSKGLRFVGIDQVKPISVNARFYQRLDTRIDAVNSRGILAAIVLTWALRPEDSGNALPESEVVRLMRYLVARYSANHVVWILTGDTIYEGASGERWKRIGRAVFDGRPHAPVSTHPNSLRWPWRNFRDERWLDFLIYQSGHHDDAKALRWIHSGPPSQGWQDLPSRPIINLEPPYEGHLAYQSGKPHTDFTTRRAIYWSLLNAPIAGVTYGAHGVWSWHTAVGQPPTDHPNTGIAKTWREALGLPGSEQMKHLAEFFSSFAWWTLEPKGELLTKQPYGDEPALHVSATASKDGNLALFYLPFGGKLKPTNATLQNGLGVQWFNPRTGSRISVNRSEGGVYQTPDQQDWVLFLARK
jgi:hypothetical protein